MNYGKSAGRQNCWLLVHRRKHTFNNKNFNIQVVLQLLEWSQPTVSFILVNCFQAKSILPAQTAKVEGNTVPQHERNDDVDFRHEILP